MYKTAAVGDVLKDHLETESVSQLITLEEAENIKWPVRMGRAVLSVFSPLL
jgi:cardiolipin synthase